MQTRVQTSPLICTVLSASLMFCSLESLNDLPNAFKTSSWSLQLIRVDQALSGGKPWQHLFFFCFFFLFFLGGGWLGANGGSFEPIWDSGKRGIGILFFLPASRIVIQDLKGTATLMISMFYQKELYEPWILIQISSKLVEKWVSYGHLKNSIWPTFSRHFEYLISFQNFFNCLIFSNHYYHIICVSADMQLYA